MYLLLAVAGHAYAQSPLQQNVITTSAKGALTVHAADLTGNGTQDVLSVGANEIAWYENQGEGRFSDPKVITADTDGAESLHAADLTGSGAHDVLSAGGNKIAWYENPF